MQRKKTSSIAAVLLAFALLPAPAGAWGAGTYLEYVWGSQEIEFDLVDASFTNHRFGAGFVLDTNVARDELLGLRVGLGYLRTENTVGDQAHGGAFDLAVSFGVWRTPRLRVFVAPAIRVGADVYESKLADVFDLSVGGGAIAGLNWHLAERLSLSPTLAYQYMYVRESIEDDFGKDRYTGGEHVFRARVTLLFRDAADFF
ncbi:MAG: hypothetical protein ACI9QQ_000317 [Myxococcota bacterium]|jgi:hypothetical protein